MEREVDAVFEITAYARASSDLEGPALRFPRVRGFRLPLVADVIRMGRSASIRGRTDSPTLDLSAPAPRTTAKWGVDATVPLGKDEEFAPVY